MNMRSVGNNNFQYFTSLINLRGGESDSGKSVQMYIQVTNIVYVLTNHHVVKTMKHRFHHSNNYTVQQI